MSPKRCVIMYFSSQTSSTSILPIVCSLITVCDNSYFLLVTRVHSESVGMLPATIFPASDSDLKRRRQGTDRGPYAISYELYHMKWYVKNSPPCFLFVISGRDILRQNFDIHVAHCERNLIRCNDCKDMIPKDSKDIHYNEFHAQVRCLQQFWTTLPNWKKPKFTDSCLHIFYFNSGRQPVVRMTSHESLTRSTQNDCAIHAQLLMPIFDVHVQFRNAWPRHK